MTKELFVSSTPHETRVGLVEDDQLAEIYLERENEYTLAGSIYKGRVTRVLPGMQSAFVDIGLERDAFLYVSDFMELEDSDEVEEVAAGRPAPEPRFQPQPAAESGFAEAGAAATAVAPAPSQDEASESHNHQDESRPSPSSSEPRGERGGWRGRRRRGRRGDRGIPESKFARPAETPQEQRSSPEPRSSHERRSSLDDRSYGPPPGYQPILLPGESISKYQRMAHTPVPETHADAARHSPLPEAAARPIADAFPDDEPLFVSEHEGDTEAQAVIEEPHTEAVGKAGTLDESGPEGEESAEASPWDAEQQRLHQMNVARVFGGAEPGNVEEIEEEEAPGIEDDDRRTVVPEPSGQIPKSAASGTMEEEEIEDEEADLAAYVEELEEDAAFEEMEEETHAAGEHPSVAVQEIAASTEPESVPGFSAEAVSPEEAEIAEASDVDEAAEEEAEVDEAQAEAEALLEAEGRESGTVDATVEVRAPSGTAAYAQRAQRPAFDRRGPRGRRGGGRRFRRRENHQLPQISDLLKEGQEILVQIAKEPIGKKGARITSHIALPGRFLVFMPTVNHTGVSRKIASEEERQRLKRIVMSERENGHGGFIVRTAAQNASEDELRADIRFLKGLWNEIRTRAENSKPPALIYHDLNVVERVLRDQVTSDFSVIWVDTEAEYERTLRFFQRFQPALVKRVKLYSKETPLFEQFGLNEEINKALKSKVWLKSGGYIVINQTEALVAIDVNTGKYVGKTARLEDTIVKTNVDAIREIVRQVRLRDLGGIIVIDFIDMDERRNRQKVMQALEEALRSDRAPSKALQFNDFGLVAITRKRVKQSLERTLCTPCPYCEGAGYVKSAQTVIGEILQEANKIAKVVEGKDVMLRVNPDVGKLLKSNQNTYLQELEEILGRPVIVKSDAQLHQEKFDMA